MDTKKILYGIIILIGVLLIFQAGVMVGYHKANFSYGRMDNYNKAFGSRRGMPAMMKNDFSDAHGAAGKIVKVSLPTVVLEDQDGTEKTILITDSTLIKEMRDNASTTALKEGEFIVVLGTPNDKAQVVASLIRLLPAPTETASGTSVILKR
jgi:hypothetical protein